PSPHFMLKEINEQVEASARTLKGRLDAQFSTAHLGGLELSARELLAIRRVKILGCGSAFYAGLAGAHVIESLTRVPAHAAPASEVPYPNPLVGNEGLFVAGGPSGENPHPPAAGPRSPRRGGPLPG